MSRCLRFAFVGLVGLLQGCVLGVGWLPDSTGFVFTNPKGELIHYVLATKQQRRVLTDPAAASTCWPAVNQNGQIALAHLSGSDATRVADLEIVICDLKGKVETRFAKPKFATFNGDGLEYFTQLVWSPDGKKLIVHGQGMPNGGTGFDSTALFDVAGQSLLVFEQQVPAYFGNTPVRPDGAGFLLVSRKTKEQEAAVDEYAWVDWQGRRTVIRPSVERRELEDEFPFPWTALGDSRWNGTKAIVRSPRAMFTVDTQQRTEAMIQRPDADEKLGSEVIQKRVKLASGVELLLLVEEKQENQQQPVAVRLVARQSGDAKVTEVVAPIRDRMHVLDAAPDGRHAIHRVSYGPRGKKGDTIHVLGPDGKLEETIKVVSRE